MRRIVTQISYKNFAANDVLLSGRLSTIAAFRGLRYSSANGHLSVALGQTPVLPIFFTDHLTMLQMAKNKTLARSILTNEGSIANPD